MLVTPGIGVTVQYRDTAGATAGVQATATGVAAPTYLAIAHGGLTLYAFLSSDGVNWTMIPGSRATSPRSTPPRWWAWP